MIYLKITKFILIRPVAWVYKKNQQRCVLSSIQGFDMARLLLPLLALSLVCLSGVKGR